MKLINSSLLILTVFLSCGLKAQKKEDSITKPNERIQVVKEYDKEGNVVRYDSSYVYTWSSDSCFDFRNDTICVHRHYPHFGNMKRIMRKHIHRFSSSDTLPQEMFGYPFFEKDFFRDDFFSDSIFDNESFPEFEEMINKHMELREKHLKEMRFLTDSIQKELNKFYQTLPNIYEH